MTTAIKQPKKRCGNCAHAMESPVPDQVFCIEGPPIPLFINGGVFSHFPVLMRWAKCDRFAAGKVQSSIGSGK